MDKRLARCLNIIFGLLFSAISTAAPDRYSEYFMEKQVDWFSLGIHIARMQLDGVRRHQDFPEGIGIGLIYDWDKDEFKIWSSGGEEVTDDKCIDALGQIRNRFAIDKNGVPFEFGPLFHAAFLPNGFSYNDVPSNMAEKMADKVIFNCNDKTYSLIK